MPPSTGALSPSDRSRLGDPPFPVDPQLLPFVVALLNGSADRLLHPQDGNRAWLHAELGMLLLRLGDKQQAKHQFETALQHNATNPIARDGLKWL